MPQPAPEYARRNRIAGKVRPDIDKLPPWTRDPLERLEHTLAAHTDGPDTAMALYATLTTNPAPGVPAQTGITWADLKALAAEIRRYRTAGGNA